MKTRRLLLLFFFCFPMGLLAQDSPATYWVKLKDKKGTPYQITQPEDFLSQRSIDRRLKQRIGIDETDLPVSPVYLDRLEELGAEVVHSSKWLNGATVRIADTALIEAIAALPFVELVQLTKPSNLMKSARQKFKEPEGVADVPPAHYGDAYNQLDQLNGQFLHNNGFRGWGIHIAVLDAGFWKVNEIEAFDSLRSSNRILGIRDIVDPQSDFYQQDSHGMSVLSTMGGNIPGTLVGTAPDASFYLIRSEDAATEYLIEEDNWVVAAELADSAGVDVINSSLGYSVFDDPQMNHPYTDMNGTTTRITQGANKAFEKGILVFASAGNEGNDPWRYIISPSDGEKVLAVGAVDQSGNRALFSSVGPAFGGAVKPNVAARGASTFLVRGNGEIGYSNGTSFSSPVLAGMGACLLQSNPEATVIQIKQGIEQSAHLYSTPDSLMGFGIPDFRKADQIVKSLVEKMKSEVASWEVLPNPFSESITIRQLTFEGFESCHIRIYSLQGVNLWESTFSPSPIIRLSNLGRLPQGVLILNIRSAGKQEQFKLIKTSK